MPDVSSGLSRNSCSRWALLTAYLLLAVLYSVVNPILESPDEIAHFAYVLHLADSGTLPVQSATANTAFAQEGSQPPLYYAIGAALIAQVDTSDRHKVQVGNPYVQTGVSMPTDNVNALVHTPAERWPWHGTTLAVHLLRLLSIALGAGSVLGVFSLGEAVFGKDSIIGLGGAALSVFNPMLLYMSSSISNDNLIICLATWELVAMVRAIRDGPTPGRVIVLGVLSGLGALSKVSGIALLPLAASVVAFPCLGLRSYEPTSQAHHCSAAWRPALCIVRNITAIVALAALIAGWWYARNFRLYGEPLGIATMLDIFGRRQDPMSPSLVFSEFKGFRMSYWGVFGSFMVPLRPGWVYYPLELVTLVGTLGVLRWLLSPSLRRHLQKERGTSVWLSLGILAAWVALLHVSLIRWTLMTPASQGRLVFPAIGAISLLTVLGLCAWFRPVRWPTAVLAALVFPVLISCLAPWTTLRAAYAPRPRLTLGAIPDTALPFGTTYAGLAELVAYEVSPEVLTPGDAMTLTLYWRRLAPMDKDYALYVNLLGLDAQTIAYHDSLAGMGSYPTSLWADGEIIRDRYRVSVSADAIAPVAARLNVGLYDGATMVNLPAADGEGREVLQPTLGYIKIEGRGQSAPPAYPLDYTLGAGVRLVGYDLDTSVVRPGETVLLALHWETAPMDGDYTVFVHVVAPDGTLIGQGDGPPLNGEYPTGFWGTGESLLDAHTVRISPDAPAGPATLHVGLYAADGQRLPVSLSGTPAGDSAVLGEIEILP